MNIEKLIYLALGPGLLYYSFISLRECRYNLKARHVRYYPAMLTPVTWRQYDDVNEVELMRLNDSPNAWKRMAFVNLILGIIYALIGTYLVYTTLKIPA